MNWVTVIWSIGAGACLTLALLHILVWWNSRAARVNLVFSVLAIAVASLAALELALMRKIIVPFAWHCRQENNILKEKKQLQIFVLHKPYLQIWLQCIQCIMVLMD